MSGSVNVSLSCLYKPMDDMLKCWIVYFFVKETGRFP